MASSNVQAVPTTSNSDYDKPAGKSAVSSAYGSTLTLHYDLDYKEIYKPAKRYFEHCNNRSKIFNQEEESNNDKPCHSAIKITYPFSNNNSEAARKALENVEYNDQDEENAFEAYFEKKGKKIFPDKRVLNIFGPQDSPIENKSSTKISNYVLEKNPFKWGVDVLKYDLPAPRKPYRSNNNLSYDLVPKESKDSEYLKKKIHYETKLDHTLCPKEEYSEKYVSSIRLIKPEQSTLDTDLVPCVSATPKRLFATKYVPGNLGTNMVPVVENKLSSCRVNFSCKNKESNIFFGPSEMEPIRFHKRVMFPKNSSKEPFIF